MIMFIKNNKLSKFSFIMNTETLKWKQKGHWIALHCDIDEDMSFEMYDPLGQYRKI